MAFANFTDYRARLNSPNERISIVKNSVTAVAGRVDSLWTASPFPGSAPSTAAAPTRATAGAVGQQNPSGLQRILSRVKVQNAGPRGTLILIDRLSHQGGLSGTVTTAQTTNLPTAALTRYTDGVGVMMALYAYSAVGTTATTVSATYTNSDGTGSRVTPLRDFGTTTFGGAADRFLEMSLQAGDRGVRSVESVTVTATTGTAGNFGVVLYRPIVAIPCWGPNSDADYDFDALIGFGMMNEIETDACLEFLFLGESTSSGVISLELFFSDV